MLLLALAGVFATGAAATERSYYFENLGSTEGLSQNTVTAVFQDRAGYVWIGTQDGLSQFDGYRFTHYGHDADDPATLPDSLITSIAEDAQGELWVGTRTSGLARMDPRTGTVRRAPLPANARSAREREAINALAFDPVRGLWAATGAGLERVDPVSGTRLQVLRIPDNPAPAAGIHALRLGADGTLWAASSAGLLRLPPGSMALERVAAANLGATSAVIQSRDGSIYAGTDDGLYRIDPAGVGSAQRVWPAAGGFAVSALAEDGRGRLWLGVRSQGLVVFDPAHTTVEWLRPDRDLPGSLAQAFVTTLFVDRSGLLWVGSEARGVSKTDPDGAPFRLVLDRNLAQRAVSSNNIRSIFQDASGALWLGTDGDGLKRYDAAGDRFDYYTDVLARVFPTPATDPDLRIYAIVDAGSGHLWVASNHGLALLDPVRRQAHALPVDPSGAAGLPDADVRALLRARDGSLWIGLRNAGLVHYQPEQNRWQAFRHHDGSTDSLSNDFVLTLHEDHSGRIWVGTLDGLDVVDPAHGTLLALRHDAGDPHSLSGNVVRAIHESPGGTLWIGTHSGLNRLDELTATGARLTRFLPRDGLPDATVYGILEDGMGRLWLSTNRGITCFDPADSSFRSFTVKDGLQGLEFNGGAYARLRDGRFAFGGIHGLNLFVPETIVASRYVAPVVITAVRVGNGASALSPRNGAIRIAQAERVVRFEFAALDYASPRNNRFSYRLDGFDENWIDAGTRHDATYTNLDAGRYTFRVRATNRDGYWNRQGAALDLVVVPPWWSERAMKVLYGIIAAAAVLLLLASYRRKRREERRHHQELREREDHLRMALWGSGDEFWDWNLHDDALVRIGADQLLGAAPRERISGLEWKRKVVHPDDLPLLESRIDDHIAGRTEVFESEHRLCTSRGEWVWALARGKVVERDADGTPLRICGTARDITASRLAERERRIAEEVIRNMTEAVTVTSLDFRFLSVNPAFTRMTGWRADEVLGRPSALLNCAQHPPEHYQAMRDALQKNGHWRGEMWQRRKDGEEFLCWLELTEVRDANGVRTQFVGVLNDITDRKRAEQELRYLANYDTLTGLPNRTLLSERLGHAIIRARRGSRKVAVLFLDLDRFKHVNDSMGHAAGDRMLKAAGARLRQVVRDGDTVARLGGDEFTVVLEDLASSREAERVAQKLIAAFEQPLELDNGQEVVISPSIGISLYPDHGQVPTDLLKFADIAMYQAKERGRNTYMFYTEAMDAAARLRATMIGALRKAIERNEFSLVYQPKLSLLDERITGVEVLLRWRSEEFGGVSPAVFIPIAEETGLIIEIGDWVLRQACAQLVRWRTAGVHELTMSVNVSVLQLLRGELTQRLCDVLAEYDIAPNQLELELTESMVMANAEQSITTLRQLKAVGVTLVIDDFGTGYSSLSYLKRLPIDTLKIDKEFVGDITTDPDDEAITATIITMAHSLGLNVVAEGVEISEQVEYLREQGCDEIQGYWLAAPMPADECATFLRERALRRRIALGEMDDGLAGSR